jgi:YgiT-type zinc finger domain-containing protein
MVRKSGEIDLRIAGRLYLVENVSYEECPSCGEKVLLPEVSEVLFEKIASKDFVEQTIRVPVLDGTYG